ncbi:hypothetical protein PIROE2DRAFT_46780, partial [Piromyces sp. E2]
MEIKVNYELREGKIEYYRIIYSNKNENIIRNLIKFGARVNHRNKYGQTALMKACHYGYINNVDFLIKNGAEINTEDVDGNTPLTNACLNHNTEIVRYLIDHGAKVNRVNKNGDTPL